MRTVITFLLLIIFFNSVSQTKQDTLKIFEVRAKEYLKQTYAEQNFDSAVIKWNKVVFLDIQEIYHKKDDSLLSLIAMPIRLKQDYQIFYNSRKNFIISNFDDENISDESENPTIYFKYSYKEKIKGQDSTGTSYLYFIFDKELSEWTIWDFRISEILGDPNRWLK
ncbi:MAG: hypothetical protein ABIP30_07770 [Ferruginibacter sp.]